jgi:hypothetical protein
MVIFMSSNKRAKEELIRHYGAECFIEKLKLRKEPKKHYTGKGQMKRMKQLTYHHIKMKKDGGRATRENGALLSAENHSWFHQQSPQAQGYMNAMFQEYKRQVDECQVVFVDELDLDFEVRPAIIAIDEKGHILDQPKEKYNRAKVKEEFRRKVDEALAEIDER